MTCLYRAGRQADALALYQGVRRRFAAELGLEPSPELRALERRILEHDPALGRRLAGGRVRRRRRITRLRVVFLASALAALAAISLLAVELGTGRTSLAIGAPLTDAFQAEVCCPVHPRCALTGHR
jgi:hypothetical protein